ncbi:hypothetical protein V8G54_014840 [Vigna mungo]|uniref:Uncharacterized protein n=1 Tax=Vigna mungo TaxID=3915 RepID=A0AAQ3NID6_VIGMU
MRLKEVDACELRWRTVTRSLEDLRSVRGEVVGKEGGSALDSTIGELVHLDMQREMMVESIYKERCITVNDGPSWTKYMLISGSPDDEYDIITLHYTEHGLLSVDENGEGRAAAFGDEIAVAVKRKMMVNVLCFY